jgi:hypothetical protein
LRQYVSERQIAGGRIGLQVQAVVGHADFHALKAVGPGVAGDLLQACLGTSEDADAGCILGAQVPAGKGECLLHRRVAAGQDLVVGHRLAQVADRGGHGVAVGVAETSSFA